MNRLLITLLLAVVMALSGVVHASPITDLQQRLSGFTTMTANFKQTLYTGKKNPAQTSTGRMALQRPGKFVWVTNSPNKQKLIANGKIAWVYDIDLEQATKQTIDSSNANSPAVFLTGDVSSLPERFTVSEKGDAFVLVAKQKDDMFQRFTLTFKGNRLTQMLVKTKMDQTSRFDFTKVTLNQKLPSNLFVFKPPKGIDILENS